MLVYKEDLNFHPHFQYFDASFFIVSDDTNPAQEPGLYFIQNTGGCRTGFPGQYIVLEQDLKRNDIPYDRVPTFQVKGLGELYREFAENAIQLQIPDGAEPLEVRMLQLMAKLPEVSVEFYDLKFWVAASAWRDCEKQPARTAKIPALAI